MQGYRQHGCREEGEDFIKIQIEQAIVIVVSTTASCQESNE